MPSSLTPSTCAISPRDGKLIMIPMSREWLREAPNPTKPPPRILEEAPNEARAPPPPPPQAGRAGSWPSEVARSGGAAERVEVQRETKIKSSRSWSGTPVVTWREGRLQTLRHPDSTPSSFAFNNISLPPQAFAIYAPVLIAISHQLAAEREEEKEARLLPAFSPTSFSRPLQSIDSHATHILSLGYAARVWKKAFCGDAALE